MMAVREKLTQQATAALGKVLNPEQRDRVNQILVQVQGTSVFQDPKAAEALKLTDEQKDQIRTLIDESQEELRAAMQAPREGDEEGRPDFQAMAAQRQRIEQATKEKILALLTDEQRAIWDERTGDPFELPAGARFGGFGGFGGPGPGGRGPGGGGGRGPGGGGFGPGGGGRGPGGPGGPGSGS